MKDGELREKLRAAGLRVTQARLAVLRALTGAGTPSSHPELYASLQDDGWDRATLYRNLTDLTEAGLLRRVDLGDHVWRFELLRPDGDHAPTRHPHFVCNECGTVQCLPDGVVELKPGRGVPRALAGAGLEIQLKGRCDRCA